MKPLFPYPLLVITVLYGFSLETALAQCADQTTITYWNNYTLRETDNTVYSYASTGPTAGGYGPLWQPFVSTWLSKDGTQLDSHIRDSYPAGNGNYVSRWYRNTLQVVGPGQFRLQSYHEVYAAACNRWAPPYQNGWNGWANSYKTVARPTLARTRVPYWLGGPTSANDYSSQTTMSVANRNEATSTPTWYFWYVQDFGTLNCTTCNTPTFTATKAPTGCGAYNLALKANFGGFDSDPFWIDIQTPNLLSFLRTEGLTPSGGGWQSDVFYRIYDGCVLRMTNVNANEVFTQWERYNGSNWTAPLAADYWPQMQFDQRDYGWVLRDRLYEVPGTGYNPRPWNEGTHGYDESSASLMTRHLQQFRVGATYNAAPTGYPANPGGPKQGDSARAQGVLVQTNYHYHYLDHGNHGRR